jgi:hypothetical protein
MIFNLVKKATAVTNLATEKGVPISSTDKIFQIVVRVNTEVAPAAAAAALAASLAATVKIQATNDPLGEFWFDVLTSKTVTKGAGIAAASDKFGLHSEPWSNYRAVIESIGAGITVDVFFAASSR